MNILITGATGFIGRSLVNAIHKIPGWNIIAVVRKVDSDFPDNIRQFEIKDIYLQKDWSDVLKNTDVIIHTAARVHIMSDSSVNPAQEFSNINKSATLKLARQAADNRVKRFIYISTIKVNGEMTCVGSPFTEDDERMPADHYANSKFEAEQGLEGICRQTTMEYVIIRPPLVYGPGVKGNFLSMMKWLYNGVPLPLGRADNKRSLISLANLTSLILICVSHQRAANQTFLASDGKDLSVRELLICLADALGKPARILSIPVWTIKVCAGLFGKKDVAQRLLGTLQVSTNKANNLLGWTPYESVEEGLKRTADQFLKSVNKK